MLANCVTLSENNEGDLVIQKHVTLRVTVITYWAVISILTLVSVLQAFCYYVRWTNSATGLTEQQTYWCSRVLPALC